MFLTCLCLWAGRARGEVPSLVVVASADHPFRGDFDQELQASGLPYMFAASPPGREQNWLWLRRDPDRAELWLAGSGAAPAFVRTLQGRQPHERRRQVLQAIEDARARIFYPEVPAALGREVVPPPLAPQPLPLSSSGPPMPAPARPRRHEPLVTVVAKPQRAPAPAPPRPKKAADASSTPARRVANAASASSAGRLELGLGGTLAVMPGTGTRTTFVTAAGGWWWRPDWLVRVAARLPVEASAVRETEGIVQPRTFEGRLELRWYGRAPALRLRPFVGAALGVSHLVATGRPNPGYVASRLGLTSALLSGALGVRARVARNFAITLAANVETLRPSPRITFAGREVARYTGPRLCASLQLDYAF